MSKDYKIIRMGRGGTIYARVPDGIETGDLYIGSKKRYVEEVSEWQARIAELEAAQPLLSDSKAVQKMFRTLAAKPESGWTYQLSLALDDGFRFYDMVVADVGHSDKNYVFQCDGLESLLKQKATRIATLEAENKAYDLRMANDAKTIAELQADPPPEGFPSLEDWLAARGFSIILEQASEEMRSWQVFDFDGEIGEPFPDYPAALAAAKKEAGR